MILWVVVIFIININNSIVESQELDECSVLKFDDKSVENCGPQSWKIYENESAAIDFDGYEYKYILGAFGKGEFCSHLPMNLKVKGESTFFVECYLRTENSGFNINIRFEENLKEFHVPFDFQHQWIMFTDAYVVEGDDVKIQFHANLVESGFILIKYIRICADPTSESTATTTTDSTKTSTILQTTTLPIATTTDISTDETTRIELCTESPLTEATETDIGKTLWMGLAITWMSLFVVAVIVIILLMTKNRIKTSQPVFLQINSTAPIYCDNLGFQRPRDYPRLGNPITNVYHY